MGPVTLSLEEGPAFFSFSAFHALAKLRIAALQRPFATSKNFGLQVLCQMTQPQWIYQQIGPLLNAVFSNVVPSKKPCEALMPKTFK